MERARNSSLPLAHTLRIPTQNSQTTQERHTDDRSEKTNDHEFVKRRREQKAKRPRARGTERSSQRKGEQNREGRYLVSESVEGSSLSLEGVDDIESGDGLPLGVLSVGDRVSDDV